jgi:hypothetical protein
MTHPNRTYLWQVPSNGLAHTRGSWYVAADRTLGDAWALLAPVRRASHGAWEIAAPADAQFQLTRVVVESLRELAFPEGERASHYVCLLRYDYPEDRPGSAFQPAGDLAHHRSAPIPAAPSAGVVDKALAQELQAALARVARQLGDDLQRQFIRAPAGAQPAKEDLAFVFASCQYPSGMLDRDQAIRSYQALARRFGDGPPERLLLLGDQVYTDATYGLLDPTQMDDRYRLPYEQLSAPQGPLAQLPQDFRRVMRMTPDDHEIVNDWEPWGPRARGERYRHGLASYWRYQRGENSGEGKDIWIKEAAEAGTGRRWQLFMADTRTQREYRSEKTLATASLLGARQTDELEQWLADTRREDLKIITSPAMLLPRTRTCVGEPLRLDGWQGYPASFHRLLAFLCDHEIPNVVFLSGDAHLGVRARITVRKRGTQQRVAFESHHTPALYAPYPFANESRWNLLLRDRFTFAWGTGKAAATYDCTVAATTLEEGVFGAGLLRARPTESGWDLRVGFVLA